jgi:phospholipase/carboxylesterase
MKRIFLHASLLAFLGGVSLLSACLPRLTVLHKGGNGPAAIMLLHGYGSNAEQWLPYADTIPFDASGRLLFPQGPLLVTRTDGVPAGRAWWKLDLAAHRRPGKPGVDLSTADPAGLDRAAKMVRAAMVNEGSTPARPFVLGGFSQGAMVSCQVAFATDTPLAALLILSGTTINLDGWKRGFAKRKALPIFMAHGRSDSILPFDLAEKLYQEFVAAGLNVTFVAFDGDHEIPGEVVVAIGEFLGKLGMGRR